MQGLSSPHSLEDWLQLIERRHGKAVDLGLERCREVWEHLGSPLPADRIYVIAGTNGKGSTVAMLCALLDDLGYRQGSYTSPHLLRFNERIKVGQAEVTDSELIEAFEQVESARNGVSLSYFEFSTLAAIWHLSRQNLDFAVMEIGLGGRLDAVNLLDADCAVITTVGLDHQEYLGEDREAIGFEKAGIVRDGRPLICGESDPPDSVSEQAREMKAPLYRYAHEFKAVRQGSEWRFVMDDISLELPLPVLSGDHQLQNAATALAALLQLVPCAHHHPDALATALRTVGLRGRLERVGARPAVWIDVGHNPMAARAVAEGLVALMACEGIQRCRCVLAMLADKDAVSVADELNPVIFAWYCAGLEGERGRHAEKLAQSVKQSGTAADISQYKTVGEALDAALGDSRAEDCVLVFGSFLTAAAAARWLEDRRATTSAG